MTVDVTFRIRGLGSGQREDARKSLPHAFIERGDVVINSPLAPDATPNDHLVWLWGVLKHNRRQLKRMQADGAHLSVVCAVSKGPVHIHPNGAEMIHLLDAELVIEAR